VRAARSERGVPWWLWTAAAVLAVAALVAGLGGFGDRVPSEVPVLELGEAWTGGELRTTVNWVSFTNVDPVSGYVLTDGEVFILVDVTLENLTDRPTIFGRDAVLIEVPDVVTAETSPDAFLEQRTGDGLLFVQPGVPVDVYFRWQVPAASVAVDDTIYLGIFERFPVADDPVFGDTAYTGPRFVARIETVLHRGEIAVEP